MSKDDTLAAYSDFTKWCRDNPHLDLDSRPHSHGGSIGDGGYISDQKTRVAFAAWRAAIEADRQRRGVNSTHTLGEPECNHCGGTSDVSGEYPGMACSACAGTGKAPQPAEPCVASVSDKTACGAANGNCAPQPTEPLSSNPRPLSSKSND